MNADASGEPVLSRAEFLHALDARSSEKRVCQAVQLNLADIKAAFYQLTGALAKDSQLLTPLTVCPRSFCCLYLASTLCITAEITAPAKHSLQMVSFRILQSLSSLLGLPLSH